MLMIAFWLAVVTFFIPKKYKNIFGYVSIAISVLGLILVLISYFSHQISPGNAFSGGILISFGWQINPIAWIFHNIRYHSRVASLIGSILKICIQIGLGLLAIQFSLIKYESDKDYDNDSMLSNDVITNTNDGKLLRVIEVNAGICTGTLRGSTIETRINQMASQGWKFEQYETIIGRCCLFFPRYKAVICFSKTN